MLTLKALKMMVSNVEGMERVPNYYSLKKINIPIVVKEVVGKHNEVTVYANGLVSYIADGHAVVFQLHSCESYIYECASTPAQTINRDFFENERWYIRLILEGEDRIANNIAKQEQIRKVSYHAYEEEWEIPSQEDSMLDQIILRENMKRILAALTSKQRKVVIQKYIEERGQKKISEILGISQQTVSETIHQSIGKLRILFSFEDFF